MKRLISGAAMAAVLFAGCTVEQIEGEFITDGFVLKVNVPGTKTVFDGDTYAVNWESGDELGVYIAQGAEGTLYKFTKTENVNEFSCTGFAPEDGAEYTYYVVYPYAQDFSVTEGVSSAVIKIGNGAGAAADIDTPLYGMATATGSASPEVTLRHLASVVKVTVDNRTSSALDISKISLDSEVLALSGTYSVNFTTGALTASQSSASASATLTGESVAASSTATYFIACAPFTFGSFTVNVNVNDGELSAAKSGVTFEAGKVYGTTVLADSKIYVDFGKNRLPSTNPWNNNVSYVTVSDTPIILNDSNGNATDIKLSITAPFSSLWNGVGTENKAINEIFEGDGYVFPYNAWTDAVVIGTTSKTSEGDIGPATVKIEGLDPSATYTLAILSCRWEGSTGPRKVKLQARGATTSEAYTVDTGMPKDNAWTSFNLDSYVTVISNITPDTDGAVYLDVTAVDTGHKTVVEGHLNALIIDKE